MSWWIYLQDEEGNTIETDTLRQEGGSQVFGGHTEAELNVTYNYGRHFDFKQLDGVAAEDAIPILKDTMSKLNNEKHFNYWEPTEGNVRWAVGILLDFAEYAVKHKIKSKFVVH